jgi:hypothetical protein
MAGACCDMRPRGLPSPVPVTCWRAMPHAELPRSQPRWCRRWCFSCWWTHGHPCRSRNCSAWSWPSSSSCRHHCWVRPGGCIRIPGPLASSSARSPASPRTSWSPQPAGPPGDVQPLAPGRTRGPARRHGLRDAVCVVRLGQRRGSGVGVARRVAQVTGPVAGRRRGGDARVRDRAGVDARPGRRPVRAVLHAAGGARHARLSRDSRAWGASRLAPLPLGAPLRGARPICPLWSGKPEVRVRVSTTECP